MIGTDINADVLAQLQDTGNIHTNPADILRWINNGVRAVIEVKPKAGTVTKLLDLVVGTRQALPSTSIQLLDILTNMGTDGLTVGRSITMVTLDRMTAARMGWRRESGQTVKHAMVDDRDNTVFYVWPGPAVATKVEARTVDLPAEITALGQTVPLDNSYKNALVHYVLYLAHAQDASHNTSMELAMTHFAAFQSALGMQTQKQKRAGPGANSPTAIGAPAVDKNGA